MYILSCICYYPPKSLYCSLGSLDTVLMKMKLVKIKLFQTMTFSFLSEKFLINVGSIRNSVDYVHSFIFKIQSKKAYLKVTGSTETGMIISVYEKHSISQMLRWQGSGCIFYIFLKKMFKPNNKELSISFPVPFTCTGLSWKIPSSEFRVGKDLLPENAFILPNIYSKKYSQCLGDFSQLFLLLL